MANGDFLYEITEIISFEIAAECVNSNKDRSGLDFYSCIVIYVVEHRSSSPSKLLVVNTTNLLN